MGIGSFLLVIAALFVLANQLLAKNDPIETVPGETYSRAVVNIAQAIARAEGYGVAGAIPTNRFNPGDLKDPSTGVIRTFDSEQAGWDALYHQVNLMVTGTSRIYNPSMTWAEVASHYDGETSIDASTGEPLFMQWARNVAGALGVDVNSTIQDYVGGFQS